MMSNVKQENLKAEYALRTYNMAKKINREQNSDTLPLKKRMNFDIEEEKKGFFFFFFFC